MDEMFVLEPRDVRIASPSEATGTSVCREGEHVQRSVSLSQVKETGKGLVTGESQDPCSLFQTVNQNATSYLQKQETKASSCSEDMKLLDEKFRNTLWELSVQREQDIGSNILLGHIQWFKILQSEQHEDLAARPLKHSEHVSLVQVELCVADIFERITHKLLNTEYIYSFLNEKFPISIHDMKGLLAKSPLFKYDATTGSWKKRHCTKGTITGNQESHWRGIMFLRGVWSYCGCSFSNKDGITFQRQDVKVKCLSLIINRSVMSVNQISQELCYALHIPWTLQVVKSVQESLESSWQFSLFRRERDIEKEAKGFVCAGEHLEKKKQMYIKQSSQESANSVSSSSSTLCGGTTLSAVGTVKTAPSSMLSNGSALPHVDATQTFSNLMIMSSEQPLPCTPQSEVDASKVAHILSSPADGFVGDYQRNTVEKLGQEDTECTSHQKKRKKTATVLNHNNTIIDSVTEERYFPPLQQGWIREVVKRSGQERCDIYYHPPIGKKLRSTVEIDTYLKKENVEYLTTKNFSFQSTPFGFGEPYEHCRDALEYRSFSKKHLCDEKKVAITSSKSKKPFSVYGTNTPIKSYKKKTRRSEKQEIKNPTTTGMPASALSRDEYLSISCFDDPYIQTDKFEVDVEIGETTGYEDWLPPSKGRPHNKRKANILERTCSKKGLELPEKNAMHQELNILEKSKDSNIIISVSQDGNNDTSDNANYSHKVCSKSSNNLVGVLQDKSALPISTERSTLNKIPPIDDTHNRSLEVQMNERENDEFELDEAELKLEIIGPVKNKTEYGEFHSEEAEFKLEIFDQVKNEFTVNTGCTTALSNEDKHRDLEFEKTYLNVAGSHFGLRLQSANQKELLMSSLDVKHEPLSSPEKHREEENIFTNGRGCDKEISPLKDISVQSRCDLLGERNLNIHKLSYVQTGQYSEKLESHLEEPLRLWYTPTRAKSVKNVRAGNKDSRNMKKVSSSGLTGLKSAMSITAAKEPQTLYQRVGSSLQASNDPSIVMMQVNGAGPTTAPPGVMHQNRYCWQQGIRWTIPSTLPL